MGNLGKVLTVISVTLFLTLCIVVTKPAFSATPAQNSWAELAPMHVARSALRMVAVDSKIYAIGGSDLTYLSETGDGNIGGTVGTNEQYDPKTNIWTYKTPMPTPLAGFPITVYQNKIYCFAKNLTEIYDPSTDTWESKTSPAPELTAVASLINGKIYLTGFSGSTQNIVYDPLTDSWSNKSPVPTINADYVVAAVDTKIYCIGPSYQGSEGINWVYDTQTDTWGKARGYYQASYFFSTAVATSGVVAPKRLYGIGLMNGYGVMGGVAVYNPETDNWSNAADMASKRGRGFGATCLDDLIYVAGGSTTTYATILGQNLTQFASLEVYIPFGYGTITPNVFINSPANLNYSSSSISLNYSVNQPINWTGFSVDGKQNVTISGNTTLAGLANGLHNITVYANDTFGNMGSQTVTFTIDKPQSSILQITIIIAVIAVPVAIVCFIIGILLYYRRHRKTANLRRAFAWADCRGS